MPETKSKQPKQPKPSAEKPVAKKVEIEIESYAYACALCGKGSVGWTVTGEIKTNPANETYVQLPLKHEVCGQEIILDVKLEELQ